MPKLLRGLRWITVNWWIAHLVGPVSAQKIQRMCPPLRLHTVDAVRQKVVLLSSAVHRNCSPRYIHVRCRRYCKAIVSSPLTFTLKRSTRWGAASEHWSSTGTERWDVQRKNEIRDDGSFPRECVNVWHTVAFEVHCRKTSYYYVTSVTHCYSRCYTDCDVLV